MLEMLHDSAGSSGLRLVATPSSPTVLSVLSVVRALGAHSAQCGNGKTISLAKVSRVC